MARYKIGQTGLSLGGCKIGSIERDVPRGKEIGNVADNYHRHPCVYLIVNYGDVFVQMVETVICFSVDIHRPLAAVARKRDIVVKTEDVAIHDDVVIGLPLLQGVNRNQKTPFSKRRIIRVLRNQVVGNDY